MQRRQQSVDCLIDIKVFRFSCLQLFGPDQFLRLRQSGTRLYQSRTVIASFLTTLSAVLFQAANVQVLCVISVRVFMSVQRFARANVNGVEFLEDRKLSDALLFDDGLSCRKMDDLGNSAAGRFFWAFLFFCGDQIDSDT